MGIAAQILIAIFGVTAVWLSQDERENVRRYACLFGLAGQPAWFYAAYTSEQWGIFALCFLYSFSWLRGFRQYWLPKSAPSLIDDLNYLRSILPPAPISTYPKVDDGEVLGAMEKERQARIARAVDEINKIFPPQPPEVDWLTKWIAEMRSASLCIDLQASETASINFFLDQLEKARPETVTMGIK